jgi:hypothetical protein
MMIDGSGGFRMSPIKQRLLAAIEQTPEPLLDQTLAFIEFLTTRSPSLTVLDFDPDTDLNAQILADLKASLHQGNAGQTFAIDELWDGINV